MRKVSVIGSGSWGIALAVSFSNNENEVVLYSSFKEEIDYIIENNRENKKLLPGVVIPDSIQLTNNIIDIKNSDIVVLAVPSFAIRTMCSKIKPYINCDTIVVNVAKGFEQKTNKLISQIIEEELENPYCILSGPSHAEEVAREVPTALVCASKEKTDAKKVTDALNCDYLRIYTSPDVIGTQLGGALKNVIAVVCGICEGMGYGDNTRAAIITRGVIEMERLGEKLGGMRESFQGLTGIGDLIVTCTSMHSRNRRAGLLIGKGQKADSVIKEIGTVEGYFTSYAVNSIINNENLRGSMPIFEEAYKVLFENKDPNVALSELMKRKQKDEFEIE